MLALSMSRTHGLIDLLGGASEWNSVVMGSNSSQVFSGEYIYIVYVYI